MTSLAFTERMTGHFSLGADDFVAGRERGEQDESTITFVVTISIADLDEMARDLATPASLTGHVEAPAISSERMEIERGTFEMMAFDPHHVNTYHMRYDMTFATSAGERYRLRGFKVLRTATVFNTWPATTTLYTEVRRHDGDRWGDVIGRGVMKIGVPGLLSLLRSINVEGASGRLGKLRAQLKFATAFLGRIQPLYAGDLDADSRFSADRGGPMRELRLPEPERRWKGDDDEWHSNVPGLDAYLQLTRYRGGDKGPLLLAAGYGMQASSMATPTIETTLAEYAVERGYDVWLFDYRASIALPSAHSDFTIDDVALIDWPEAVAEVRRITGAETVQAFGHCVGAVSLLMAQLAGMNGVGAIVCSQFSVHPHPGQLNRFKSAIRLPDVMHTLRIKGIEPNKFPTFVNKLLDSALVVVPMPRGERCNRPVCRWLNSMYGLTHTHAQLNDATHETFDEAFGYGSLEGLRHSELMNKRRRAVDHLGADIYVTHPERIAIPVQLVMGRKNHIFMPEGTLATYDWLREHNDPELYELLDLPDYAHLDGIVGRDASRDVFPAVFQFLDRH